MGNKINELFEHQYRVISRLDETIGQFIVQVEQFKVCLLVLSDKLGIGLAEESEFTDDKDAK